MSGLGTFMSSSCPLWLPAPKSTKQQTGHTPHTPHKVTGSFQAREHGHPALPQYRAVGQARLSPSFWRDQDSYRPDSATCGFCPAGARAAAWLQTPPGPPAGSAGSVSPCPGIWGHRAPPQANAAPCPQRSGPWPQRGQQCCACCAGTGPGPGSACRRGGTAGAALSPAPAAA